MRLHRHDELVEAMARATMSHHGCEPTDDEWRACVPKHCTCRKSAAAALDALLEAAVKLGVGWRNIRPVEEGYTLILRMEASDDK